MTIDAKIKSMIESCWSAETSAVSNWSEENPSLGQCAITAVWVHAFLGGQIMRCPPQPGMDGSHYWNRLEDGTRLDLTAQQFGGLVEIDYDGASERTADYILSYPETAKRYDVFVMRLAEELTKKEA